jgi:hypothetical protein
MKLLKYKKGWCSKMGINLDKPHLWKKDIIESVDLYNTWFMDFAPRAFRETRVLTAKSVEDALKRTNYLCDISPIILQEHPEVLPILRMSTCPPIARDRLVGLAGVSKSLVQNMEDSENPHISPRMQRERLKNELQRISNIIKKMVDPDIFTWLSEGRTPDKVEIARSSTIVADRLCGAVADPIIRNAQEKRQLLAITTLLEGKGYSMAESGIRYDEMNPGTFSFHTNVPVYVAGEQGETVNIPVDVLIMPFSAKHGDLPLLLEAKSAGDFTNVNKRRKEEAVKMQQLKNTYGTNVSYSLFLCGYFDSGYLGYEAAEGIDWIWEHRMEDLEKLGI